MPRMGCGINEVKNICVPILEPLFGTSIANILFLSLAGISVTIAFPDPVPTRPPKQHKRKTNENLAELQLHCARSQSRNPNQHFPGLRPFSMGFRPLSMGPLSMVSALCRQGSVTGLFRPRKHAAQSSPDQSVSSVWRLLPAVCRPLSWGL